MLSAQETHQNILTCHYVNLIPPPSHNKRIMTDISSHHTIHRIICNTWISFVSMCNARIIIVTAAAIVVGVCVNRYLFAYVYVCAYNKVLSHTHTLTVFTQLTSTNLDAYQKIFTEFATNTYTQYCNRTAPTINAIEY